jgi:aldehyde dehydrogenase (NAD+)
LNGTINVCDTKQLSHYIDGQWVAGPAASDSLNPSDTRDIVAKVPGGDKNTVNAAVAAAKAAFPGWSNSSPEVRSDLLDKVGSLIMARADDLGRLLSREEGKTFPEGKGEVMRAARIFKFMAGEALRRHGVTVESTRPGVAVETYREPLGVFGLITPWNFPIAIPAWKSAPALAFGNTVVMKPASLTPATAHALTEIIHEAGLPKGVFNLILGGGSMGGALVDHPDVVGISFTGGQSTGAGVGRGALAHNARVQLEMGGKNALVVLDDCELDRAVQCALDGAFFATGQRCTASSRIIITQNIHDKFVEALAARVKALKVGEALAADTQMGPLASQAQLETTLSYVDIATKEGGRRVVGGDALKLDKPGYYVSPALIADTRQDMRINCEEVFGPVASTVRVKDYDEALAVANAGEFGLSAGIMTTSLKYARHYVRNVRAGMVMTNLPTAGVDYHVPFGGSRKSSYGPREQGFAAVEFYTQIKTSYTWA